jgi:hypothetical protein
MRGRPSFTTICSSMCPTRYLHLMIRPDHEPANDNDDPWTPAFNPANFKYLENTLAIAKAARQRQPKIELLATLTTPPAWMKTNGAESGGGAAKATLKPKARIGIRRIHLGIPGPDGARRRAGEVCRHFQRAGLAPRSARMFLHARSARGIISNRRRLLRKNGHKVSRCPAGNHDRSKYPQRSGRQYQAISPPCSAALPNMSRSSRPHDYDPRGDRWGDMRRPRREKARSG